MNPGGYFFSQTNMLFSLGSWKCQLVVSVWLPTKKAALVVKNLSLSPNFIPFSFLSLTFWFFSFNHHHCHWTSWKADLSHHLSEEGNPDLLSYPDSSCNNSIVFLHKAHAIAVTLTVTLSLTQTDVIKRSFICSPNPTRLTTTKLWFHQFSLPSQWLEEKICTVTVVLITKIKYMNNYSAA